MIQLRTETEQGTTCPMCGHETVFDGICHLANCKEIATNTATPAEVLTEEKIHSILIDGNNCSFVTCTAPAHIMTCNTEKAAKEIYSLVQPLQEENKRLKEVAVNAYAEGFYHARENLDPKEREKLWQQFKTQNSIT